MTNLLFFCIPIFNSDICFNTERKSRQEKKYVIVEFKDDLQIVSTTWLNNDL